MANSDTGAAKDLLLHDFEYLSESFWRYEQTGETRFSWFTGITTAAVGGLVGSLTSKDNPLEPSQLRLVILGALLALLVFGIFTLARMATRNMNTDRCKRGLDVIRQTIKDHFDQEGVLFDYYPIASPPGRHPFTGQNSTRHGLRRFGGLTHSVAGINSLLLGGIVVAFMPVEAYQIAAATDPSRFAQDWSVALLAVVAAFVAQIVYVKRTEARNKQELAAGAITHAFAVVYRPYGDSVQYLLVRPADGTSTWVLPKGHVEPGEWHAEAALRELREETGVEAHVVRVVGRTQYRDPAGRHVHGKAYLLRYLDEGPSTEKNAREPTWFTFADAVQKATHPETRLLLNTAEMGRVGTPIN